jgi:hypothetical protein
LEGYPCATLDVHWPPIPKFGGEYEQDPFHEVETSFCVVGLDTAKAVSDAHPLLLKNKMKLICSVQDV